MTCWSKFVFGEGVITFMSTNYNFKRSLKYCCQLSQYLPRDACHPGSIKKLK